MLDLPGRISESLLLMVQDQRALAHLVVDSRDVLIQAGGHLEHYGIGALSPGACASDQLPFLAGLLPLEESPFLLSALEMPSGRIADVHFFSDATTAWVLLLDVTAEHDQQQMLQQKAYDMTLLNQREARLIARLEAANADLTRARQSLFLAHSRLQQELTEAEHYVRAILPAPLQVPFRVDWRFEPTIELGGDCLGYHWLDTEHFALYLLDVCGHGVGPALLSVAAHNTLRSGALRDTDFRRPEEVLASLNEAYQMDMHNDMYFTIWYGVYHHPSRRLRYATAGHPAPVLVSGPAEAPTGVATLNAKGPCLGMFPYSHYAAEECILPTPARLFLFSDGAFEITRPDGSMLANEEFLAFFARPVAPDVSELDQLWDFVRAEHGRGGLDDDFSILKMDI